VSENSSQEFEKNVQKIGKCLADVFTFKKELHFDISASVASFSSWYNETSFFHFITLIKFVCLGTRDFFPENISCPENQ
jgi:hypothetical protein